MFSTETASRIQTRPSSKLAPCGFDAGDANLRRYVGDDPTNLTDPSGLAPDEPVPGHPWIDYGYKRDTSTIDFLSDPLRKRGYEGYVTATIKQTDFSYWTNEGRGPNAREFKVTKFTITVKNDTWSAVLGHADKRSTQEFSAVQKGDARWVYIKPTDSINIEESWGHPVHDGEESVTAIWTFDIIPDPVPLVPGQPDKPQPLEGEIAILMLTGYGVGPNVLIVGWKLKPVISLNDGSVTYEPYIRLQEVDKIALPGDLVGSGGKLWRDTSDKYFKDFHTSDTAPFAHVPKKPEP